METLFAERVLFVECDEIEPGLFLGNLDATKDENIYTHFKITHVLTVYSYPITVPDGISVKQLFINVDDSPDENLLSHFEESNNFIRSAQDNGACLVHCFGGISRSATLVIAYLMNKHKIDFQEALNRVTSKRFCVSPNPGFISQLYLYEFMKCSIDESCARYRLFCLKNILYEIIRGNKFDNVTLYAKKAQERKSGDEFRCKMCRETLFYESNRVPHLPEKDQKWEDIHLEYAPVNPACSQSYCIEPLPWMEDVFTEKAGKISCPKCHNKIGVFSWSSQTCQCSATVAPNFKITESKVDRIKRNS